MQDPMMGVYIGVGVLAVFVIIMIIVIPKQIRKAKSRAQNAGQQMANEIERRTGLKPVGNGFEGDYKGYHIRIEKGLGTNESAIWDAKMDFFSGSSEVRDLHGRDTYYPIVRVWLTKEGANFPDVTLFQKSNYFLDTDEFWNNRINGRIPDEMKNDVDASILIKKASFYGDVDGAQKMVSSAALKNLLSTWIYPDIRAEGSQVKLELNNKNIQAKWSYKKTSANDWLIQAADICVATADALQ